MDKECVMKNEFSIDVSGQVFRVSIANLNNYPNTLLGNESKRARFWSEHEQVSKAVFLDQRTDNTFRLISLSEGQFMWNR